MIPKYTWCIPAVIMPNTMKCQILLSCDPLNWYHTYPHITTRIRYQIAYPVIVSKWGWVKTIQPIPHSPCVSPGLPQFLNPRAPACPIPQLPRWKFPFLDCLSHYNLKKMAVFHRNPNTYIHRSPYIPLMFPLYKLLAYISHIVTFVTVDIKSAWNIFGRSMENLEIVITYDKLVITWLFYRQLVVMVIINKFIMIEHGFLFWYLLENYHTKHPSDIQIPFTPSGVSLRPGQ